MVGGGFGGCVLALVQKSAAGEFQNSVAAEYRKRTGIACAIYECFAADWGGARCRQPEFDRGDNQCYRGDNQC